MKKIFTTTFLLLLSISIVNSQEKDTKKDIESSSIQVKKVKDDKIYIKVKNHKKPMIFIDGKKFDFSMDLIDQSKIASINILKGEEAIKNYNAPNGVVLITTKASKDLDFSYVKMKENGDLGEDKKSPMIIIDGKVSDKKSLEGLTPERIEKMEIFKGEKAIKKYNAPNGAIVITTKKM